MHFYAFFVHVAQCLLQTIPTLTRYPVTAGVNRDAYRAVTQLRLHIGWRLVRHQQGGSIAVPQPSDPCIVSFGQGSLCPAQYEYTSRKSGEQKPGITHIGFFVRDVKLRPIVRKKMPASGWGKFREEGEHTRVNLKTAHRQIIR